jgi:hypothetical protein
VTQIKQDTQAVHLTGVRGEALCGAELHAGAPTVSVGDWAQGFTPAALGARVCRVCVEKAGAAARFVEGEAGLPRMRPAGPGAPQDIA